MRHAPTQLFTRAAVLVSLSLAVPACSLLNRARGITENYRTDGLSVLDVRVSGLSCCGPGRPASDSVLISIQGPRGTTPIDTLTMLADRYGHAVFEGVQPGEYRLRIKPASHLVTAERRVTLRINEKRVINHDFKFWQPNKFEPPRAATPRGTTHHRPAASPPPSRPSGSAR
jgi:hypothetical protein